MKTKAFNSDDLEQKWENLLTNQKGTSDNAFHNIYEIARVYLLAIYQPFLEDWMELENALETPGGCKHKPEKLDPTLYAFHLVQERFHKKWGVVVTLPKNGKAKEITLSPRSEFNSVTVIDFDQVEDHVKRNVELNDTLDFSNKIHVAIDLRATDNQITKDLIRLVHQARSISKIDSTDFENKEFGHILQRSKTKHRPRLLSSHFKIEPQQNDFKLLKYRMGGHSLPEIVELFNDKALNAIDTKADRLRQILDFLNFYNEDWSKERPAILLKYNINEKRKGS